MRILFDGHWWFDGPASNRMVQREMIQAWVSTFPGDDVVVAVPHSALTKQTRTGPETRVVTTRAGQHALATTTELPRLARRVGADVILAHNFTPWSGPSATFIHDVIFQTHPEWFTRAEQMYFSAIPSLARRASVVLTSSHSEAERISTLNPRLRSVVPVGLAVGASLRDTVPRRPALPRGLGAFVLSVGRLNIRKNLGATIEGALLSGAIAPDRPLLIVGEPDGRAETFPPTVRAEIERGSIVFLGRVSDSELAWLYTSASALLFLSLDEGFGLPQLEALTFGCPVLLSDIPVFREVSGRHAEYCDPTNVDDIGHGIRRVLDRGRNASGDRPVLPAWSEVVTRVRAALLDSERVIDLREPLRRSGTAGMPTDLPSGTSRTRGVRGTH